MTDYRTRFESDGLNKEEVEALFQYLIFLGCAFEAHNVVIDVKTRMFVTGKGTSRVELQTIIAVQLENCGTLARFEEFGDLSTVCLTKNKGILTENG